MGRQKTYSEERAVLSVRVPKKVRTDLNKLAAADKRSLNNYVTILLEQHISTAKVQPQTA